MTGTRDSGASLRRGPWGGQSAAVARRHGREASLREHGADERHDARHFDGERDEELDADDLKMDGKNILPKLHGALLKNEQDVHLFERLAFMARRNNESN